MAGELFIVATPIGNLGDITLRAIDTLKNADVIAAEDTRHSRPLLNHLGLDKPMLSLHEHNERARIDHILDLLQQGRNVALISDAGTPLISDPGFPLTRAVIDAGLRVTPVPGASSVVAALSAAGLPTDRFCFHGFLPHRDSERERKLQRIVDQPGVHVLFESTHRIMRLLKQLQSLPEGTEVVVAKELTKRHERFIRGNASDCLERLQAEPDLQKGEFVVLLNLPELEGKDQSGIEIEHLLGILLAELPLKQAVRLAVEISGRKKNEVYRLALETAQQLRQ